MLISSSIVIILARCASVFLNTYLLDLKKNIKQFTLFHKFLLTYSGLRGAMGKISLTNSFYTGSWKLANIPRQWCRINHALDHNVLHSFQCTKIRIIYINSDFNLRPIVCLHNEQISSRVFSVKLGLYTQWIN